MLAFVFSGIGIKILLKKNGKFSGTCASQSPFLNKEAWVNTEGRFSPCCTPDEQRKQLGEFGNLYEMSLAEIWESKAYKNLQKTYMSHPLCVGCNMRKPPEEVKKVA